VLEILRAQARNPVTTDRLRYSGIFRPAIAGALGGISRGVIEGALCESLKVRRQVERGVWKVNEVFTGLLILTPN
jgi:hypothetical protein